MFELCMHRPHALARHRRAPLAAERERFIGHLHERGVHKINLRSAASHLLQFVRILQLKRPRNICDQELEKAAQAWITRRRRYSNHRPGQYSILYFRWITRKWLRYLGRLVLPKTVPQPFSDELADYTIRMRSELGYSETTIYERRQRAINFLKWYGKKRRELSRISVRDVDNYLAESARRWKLITLAGECTFLRSFFYHAGFRGWCSRSIAPAIKPPVVRRDIFEPQGPKWKDVLRLLRSMRGSDSVTIRAKAVISLYAIYGLRSSEAIRIRLRDIDWTRNSFTVRRAKRGGIQEFPMQAEVREAIRRYIEKVRPDCDCPEVFVSLHKPYRAMRSHSMGRVVSRRMKALGIESKHHGPQSLRHACATHLLDCGAHLEDIADFLGHRSCEAVRVYAKFSKRSLREVVRVDLTKSL